LRSLTVSNAKMAQVRVEATALGGGLDVQATALFTKPGTLRIAYNYESAIGGGYERIGGIERFDGRLQPNLATYAYLQCTAPHTAVLGNTVTGATSAATGKVIYVDGAFLAVTRTTGAFSDGEVLNVSASPVGTLTAAGTDPEVSGQLDNQLSALAAADYRADITIVPGSGPVRGVAILNDAVYAWRNTVDGTALALHKASSSGWTAVPLYYELSFTGGSTEPAETSTLTQGSASATVMRVVLQSGEWDAGTAAGRYIITAPTGGTFASGALSTSGAGTVPASGAGVYIASQITLSPGGRVRTDVTTFVGSANSLRLYGCDGVNREFELGSDDVLVPLETGMQGVRATAVKEHRGHLFFAYRSSLQHSGINAPYKWTVLSGAAELGTGDTITNLVSVSGSELAAALMVLCQNSVLVLYGDSAADWLLKTLSRRSGSSADSAQDVAGVVSLDAPGFVRYPPTQAFGNYRWDSVSQQVESIVRGQSCQCSVWLADRSKYRVFFTDGTAISGMPVGRGQFEWTTIDYGRKITVAVHGEITGLPRTFVGDDAGWVYECDVGRSFAGERIEYALRFNEMSYRSPSIRKQFKRVEIEGRGDSYFTLAANAEFFDADEEIPSTEDIDVSQPGNGLRWDIGNWDQAHWDAGDTGRKRFPLEGQGCSIAITLAGESDQELPHTIRALTTHYILRRQAR
jgi:hypothetical protein